MFDGNRTFCVMEGTRTACFQWFGAEDDIRTDKQRMTSGQTSRGNYLNVPDSINVIGQS